jgi:hypothetical protein
MNKITNTLLTLIAISFVGALAATATPAKVEHKIAPNCTVVVAEGYTSIEWTSPTLVSARKSAIGEKSCLVRANNLITILANNSEKPQI